MDRFITSPKNANINENNHRYTKSAIYNSTKKTDKFMVDFSYPLDERKAVIQTPFSGQRRDGGKVTGRKITEVKRLVIKLRPR